MKTNFAITLLFAAASAQDSISKPNVKEITQLLDGFLFGALKTEEVYDMEMCIKEINPLVTDLTTAIADFKDGSYYRITDGIYYLGQFVAQIKTVTKDCPNALREEDKLKLEEMADAFKNPKKLILDAGEDLIINGVEIYQDVKKGITRFDSKDYQLAGQEFGEVAALVLWGKKSMELEGITGEIGYTYVPTLEPLFLQ